uniref:Acidic mammalian chitinase n=2 Tax=Anoplophora glabripennis TaxID=217634 RepID=V5GTJ2_ANOGL
MNEYVDYINLMSYDYHFYTRFTPFTGINSPLYGTSSEKYYLATLNINYSSNYWNYLGMDRSKIIVGLPTYGHTFRLTNIWNNGLYAPSLGFGNLGSLGFVDYPEVCAFLSSNHITPVFDMDTKSPYASKSHEWISFDNTESFMYKSEFIRDNKFGGAMVYCLNSDDYRGVCQSPEGNGKKFPLVKVARQILAEPGT